MVQNIPGARDSRMSIPVPVNSEPPGLRPKSCGNKCANHNPYWPAISSHPFIHLFAGEEVARHYGLRLP